MRSPQVLRKTNLRDSGAELLQDFFRDFSPGRLEHLDVAEHGLSETGLEAIYVRTETRPPRGVGCHGVTARVRRKI